jgi:hypothetical protein
MGPDRPEVRGIEGCRRDASPVAVMVMQIGLTLGNIETALTAKRALDLAGHDSVQRATQ